jgi:hypothetical protein
MKRKTEKRKPMNIEKTNEEQKEKKPKKTQKF